MTIPVIPRGEIPMIVSDGEDWRAKLDALREAYPYFKVEGDPTIWFTRFEDCREIFLNGELFWEGPFGDAGRLDLKDIVVSNYEEAEAGVRRHIAVRQAIMPKFTPAEARRWEGRMAQVCNDLIDQFIDDGEVDFVTGFSKSYFPYIGAELLGAPREDWDMLVEWEHEAFKVPNDTEYSLMLNLYNNGTGAIMDYVAQLMKEKRKNPDDRFVSHVVQAEDAGILSSDEARWACNLFVLGSGHTVTSHLGYIFKYFAESPRLQKEFSEGSEKVDQICEELMRIYSLGGHVRTVTADTTLSGCPLKRGDKIFVHYSICNRDPRMPGFDEILLDRKPNRHIGFNLGWRQCLGMHFGKRARNIAVNEWHKRIPSYRLSPGAKLVEQVYAGVGYHHLPLEWRSGEARA